MNSYILSPQAMVKTIGSSQGSQPKFLDHGYWYKKNMKGYEGKSEYLVSQILKCSNLKNYVVYEECRINGDSSGCRCKDFTKEGEFFLSFEKMHEQYLGDSLADKLAGISEVAERINYTIDFVKLYTKLDIAEYLGNTLMLDALTLNSDRHTNNLGVIANINTGEFREAPIFDNGDALMSNFALYPPDRDFEENMKNFISYPFSVHPMEQIKYLPVTLKLNYEAVEKMLETETECRATSILKIQLELYRNIIPDTDVRIARDEGIKLGEKRGINIGKLETCAMFIEKGYATIEDIAEDMNINIEELEEYMEKNGIEIPQTGKSR